MRHSPALAATKFSMRSCKRSKEKSRPFLPVSETHSGELVENDDVMVRMELAVDRGRLIERVEEEED
jgi:hypothetical protein